MKGRQAAARWFGRCILGGVMVPQPNEAPGWGLPAFGAAGRCAAFPLFVVRGVPYTNGDVVGRSYKGLAALSSYTTLHRPPPAAAGLR